MIRKLLTLLVAVPLMLGGASAAAHSPAPLNCAGLTAAHVPQGMVTSATAADGYCQVQGVLEPATKFTVKLPVSGWTGEYVQQGCSGLCGAVPDLRFPLFGFSCPAAKDKTLVVAGDDTGHTGDPAGAQPATWGRDPRARIEFGLTSEHRLRLASDALMTAYYGHGPAYRYFDGCSTGGRQGLNLAQRFPADFDGILAGAPANNEAPLALLEAWVATRNTDAHGKQILGPEKIPTLHDAVVKTCGDVIQDPRKCGFQPSSLRCPPDVDRPTCLTPAQVAAVVAFYRGPHGLYNGGMPYGSELGWIDQFVVRSGSPLDGNAGKIAFNYLKYLGYPTVLPGRFKLTDVRFTPATYDRLNLLGNALYNANNPDLSAFRAHGGKLIMYHGWADPYIPPFSTLDYYRAVQKRGGADAYTRLYMIPAGYHCLFGPEADTSPSEIGVPEFLQPLMDWVEKGTAPGVINVPTLSGDYTDVIRDLDVAPFDALAPIKTAPDSLNANYHYVGRYYLGGPR
ncbi:tannase/feruloyl esterase family alpha/beta hydrolase [Streptomyces sp. NPDC020192]|uniref:tannase/feruloyl esterase family alpha/beta hydrolase n=1 Tax=Streptomyces sp. NPDC020192 TaxID=3365066 RepID=UPI00378C8A20